MKKIAFLLIVISNLSYGQVKLWDSQLNKIKTKGTFLTIDKEIKDIPSSLNNEIFGIIPATTIAGTLLPFAFKYGNSALKNLTSKDEKDYNSENLSLNNLIIPFEELVNDSIVFNTTLNYYPKGKSISSIASKYLFSIKKENNSVIISLDNSEQENYIPVKSKKKYDFIIETFDITVQAEIYTQLADTIQKVELSELGTTKITRTIASFTNGIENVLNSGILFYPKYNSSGKAINIKNLIITCKVTYLNSYGLKQSSINKFLENNSDTNESLLNTIFIKSEDE